MLLFTLHLSSCSNIHASQKPCGLCLIRYRGLGTKYVEEVGSSEALTLLWSGLCQAQAPPVGRAGGHGLCRDMIPRSGEPHHFMWATIITEAWIFVREHIPFCTIYGIHHTTLILSNNILLSYALKEPRRGSCLRGLSPATYSQQPLRLSSHGYL